MTELQKTLDIFSASNFQTFPLYTIEGGKCTCGETDCRSPGKHPKSIDGFKSARVHSDSNDFNGSNVGLYCGESLIVLDADKKNGGLETLKELKAKHGKDFRTVMAHTGGGGFHIFYRTHKPLKTRTGILKGVDIRANGGYVVLAPSLHLSGERYRWVNKCEPWNIPMKKAPGWLIELSEKEKLNSVPTPTKQSHRKGQGYLEGSVDWFAVSEALSRLCDRSHNYEDWLEIGMCLHSTGDSHGLEVWDNWSQQSNKYQSGVCAKKWVSFKSEGRTLGTLFHHAGISVSRKQRKREAPQKRIASEKPETKFEGTPKAPCPRGGLWQLAVAIQETCQTPYDHWAIASAVSTVSALTQGLYMTPTRSKLASYIVIVGSVAFGKNDYIRAPQQIVDCLRSLSLKPDPISTSGLLRILDEYPAIYMCRDELINYLESITANKAALIHSLLGDFCSIWGNAILRGQSNKKKDESLKIVKDPHFSIFGNGTFGGFKKLLKQEPFYKSGLLSRFDFILAPPEFIEPQIDVRYGIPSEVLDLLKTNLELPYDFLQGTNVVREAKLLDWDKEVEKKWQEWRLSISRKAHALEQNKDAKYYEIHTLGRLAEKALRYASIHTIADGRRCITMEDLEFGVAFTGRARDTLVGYLEENRAENPKDETLKKILEFIGRYSNGVTQSDITRRFQRVDRRLRQEILTDLIEGGEVIELEIKESKRTKSFSKYILASQLYQSIV